MIINKLQKEAVETEHTKTVLVYDGTAEYERYLSGLNLIARRLNEFKPVFDEALSDTGIKLNEEVIKGGWQYVNSKVDTYIRNTPKALRTHQQSFYELELNKLYNGFYQSIPTNLLQSVPAGLEYQLHFIFMNDAEVFDAKCVDKELFDKYMNADLYADLEEYCKIQNKLHDRFGDRVNYIVSALKPDSEGLKVFHNADINQIGRLAKIFNL